MGSGEFLASLVEQLQPASNSRLLPWPGAGVLPGLRSFESFEAWRSYLSQWELTSTVPQPVLEKYRRAQKLYLLGWLDVDLIKAGELIVLSALELAVRGSYGHKLLAQRVSKVRKSPCGKVLKPLDPRDIKFAHLLDYMVTQDGLTDEMLPTVQMFGGRVVCRLRSKDPLRPTLADIRNDAAHGDPFDGWPQCGLIEVTRDLIDYACRS
jgi:hypothetical protein